MASGHRSNPNDVLAEVAMAGIEEPEAVDAMLARALRTETVYCCLCIAAVARIGLRMR